MLIRIAPNDATVQNAKRNGMIAHCQRMNKGQCESTSQKMQIMLDEVRTYCTSASTKRSRTRPWQIDPSPSISSTVNRIRHRYPFSTIQCINEQAHNGSKPAHTGTHSKRRSTLHPNTNSTQWCHGSTSKIQRYDCTLPENEH